MNDTDCFSENDYEEILNTFKKLENDEQAVKSLFFNVKEDYGLFALGILVQIAYDRNISFWFKIISFFYQFEYHYIDGAQRLALFYLIKAHELELDNIGIMHGILDYMLPPEIVLTTNQSIEFAQKIIRLNPGDLRAKNILSKYQ